MSNIPANPRLWDMIIAQAKTRFHPYPSIAASAWVHQHYVQAGGRFVQHQKEVDPRQKAAEKKRKKQEKK